MIGKERKIIRDKIFDVSVYLILIFIVMIPILHNNLFLLDFVYGRNYDLGLFYGKYISKYGGSLLSTLIPGKVLIFIALFFGVYSISELIGKMTQQRIVKLYASILYLLNPFMYIRILAGNWYLLFSYAVLPLVIKSFIELLDNKERKAAIKFIFFMSLVAFSIHMLIIALIIMSIIFIFWMLKYRDIRNIRIIPIVIIIFILLNLYWIFPLITAKNTMIDNIGNEDYKVFTPRIDNLSDLFNIASMYGFWREGYIYAKDFIPYWQLLSLLIISLAIYGFISYYKDDKIGYLVKALGVIWIIGFILATGINGPFGGINHWLYDNTILKGFRDSHKFVAMLVFSYAILGGLGVNKIKSMYDGMGCKK